MKIVFVSFIDSSNIGDLLIAEVLAEKLMKGHTVLKYSFNITPEENISKYSGEKEDKINLLIKNIYNDYFRKIDFIDRLHTLKMKNAIDKNKYLNKFENDIKNSDILIIGGGNAIFDLTRHSLSAYKINKTVNIAKNHGKKIFITSIGIGPFKTQGQINYTINTLKNADYITVRDRKSFSYIESLKDKARLSIDPVFLLNKISKDKFIKQNDDGKVISICIIDLLLNKDNMKKYKKYISNFVQLVKKLKEENYTIHLFSTEPRDYRAVNDVYNALENKNKISIVKINNFEDLINLYEETNLIIGTRMHSMIIGLSQLIPVIGISWQDKVKEMFDMNNSLNDVFDIDEFEDNIPKIVELVYEKINNPQLNNDLQKMKYENSKRFHVNNELLKNLSEIIAEDHKGRVNEI